MRQKPNPRKVKSDIQLNQYSLFFKLKLVEFMRSDGGRPEGASDSYAAHRSHI